MLASQSEWITFFNYQDYAHDFEVSQAICEQIAQGSVVVLKGYPYQLAELNIESIWQNFKIPKNQLFSVSGKFYLHLIWDRKRLMN